MTRTLAPRISPQLRASLTAAIAQLPANAILIQERRGQAIYQTEISGKLYIIKHYCIQKLSSRIIAALRFSRAERSFRLANILIKDGIPTPEAHLVQLTGTIIPTKAVLITDHFQGREVPSFLATHQEASAHIAQKIAKLIHDLSAKQISHGDFHVQNILVDDQQNVCLIDLDGIRLHRFLFRSKKRYIRDRKRMISSAKEFISPEFAHILDQLIPNHPE